MVTFQAIAWEAQYRDEQYEITVYGRTKNGKSVSLTTPFNPYFFVQVPPWTTSDALFSDLKDGIVNKRPEPVQSVTLWGFTNSTKKNFLKLSFKTHEAMRKFVWRCKSKNLKVFESTIDPLLRFFHRTNIQSTGWLTCDSVEKDYSTTCDIKLYCQDWKTMKPVDDDSIAPFKISSIDIECYSESSSFPDSVNTSDVLFQIALTTKVYGSTDVQQRCFSLGPVVESDTVVLCKTEKELLDKFTEYLVHLDPDVITGWNIFGFDMEYIINRMLKCNCDPYTLCMGRRNEKECELVIKQLSSGALGDNSLKMVPMAGRYIFDLFQTIKAEHKLESYSLNNVSLHFLNDRKNDMPIHDMFKLVKNKQDLTEVAEYCIKDTELPIRLMEKLYTFENLIEMAKATWVPLSFLSERGQQIKVFSQIAKKARELGFMIPTLFTKPDQPDFEGATVLEAQIGAYYKPITALDFAGLYPSIMMAHNLCYSTLCLDDKYKNIPGVEYETHGDHTFAQNVPSLLPAILADLKAFRKNAKADMKRTKGTPMYNIYDGKQLAYKISMNSIYGFTGAARGMLPCVAIASSVTRIGRGMIQKSKEYVEEHFPGAKVRYGDTDSIMVEFDVGDRTGQDAIEYSWDLGEKAATQITEIFKRPNELELEKVYCPYFLYSKKRYAAKKWVKDGDKCEFSEIDVKGLQLVRRDNCPFVRETCKELVDMMMESNNSEQALKFIAEKRKLLVDGNIPMEKLVLSKRLGNSYKNNNLAHVVVRDKMKERAPGSEPRSGDRVQFVLLKGPSKRAKMYEKAEDYAYAKQNNLDLDYEYYTKHQFETPVKDLIEPLIN